MSTCCNPHLIFSYPYLFCSRSVPQVKLEPESDVLDEESCASPMLEKALEDATCPDNSFEL